MGKNELANPNVDSNIGIQDELGMEALEQAKVQLNKEISTFTENVESLTKGKENYIKQWEVDKRLAEIQLEGDNLMPFEPKIPLEANKEYYELVKQKIAFKLRFDTHQAEEQLKAYDIQIATMQEQIDSSQKKLKELEE